MLRNFIQNSLVGLGTATISLAAHAETEISFASWQFEEPGNGDWWKDVIAAFEEENPDISVDTISVPYSDYLPQMTVRFASNRPPSLIQLNEQIVGRFASQGWLADLNPYIEGTDIATDWAPAQQTLTWDGATRGVLLTNSAYMFFYNKRILEEAGVGVPDSWEAFKEAAAEITDRDAGVFGLSAVTTEYPTIANDMHTYTEWAGTSLVKDGEYNLTSPEVVEAIKAYRETVGQNAPLGNNSSVSRQLFIDGRTGMLLDGPWVWGWLERADETNRPDLVMDKIPFDTQRSSGGVTLHMGAGLNEETAEAAWKFIEFATRKPWQREALLMIGSPPGRASDVLSEEDKEEYPHLALTSASALDAIPLFPKDEAIQEKYQEYKDIMSEAAVRVLSTDTPVEEILAETQAELEERVPLDG